MMDDVPSYTEQPTLLLQSSNRITSPRARRTARTALAQSGDSAACHRWVTVFGFPPDQTLEVRQKFHELGEIERYVTGSGNWMHIQYRTVPVANQALGLSGHQLGAGVQFMVGVKRSDPGTVQSLLMDPALGCEAPPARLVTQRHVHHPVSYAASGPPRNVRAHYKRDNPCSRIINFFFNW